MPSIPYFSLSKHSFEKNSGYKSTVHALAELIDNSVEAEATQISVLLMVDRDNRLLKIAVADDGEGMSPENLQKAVCEKSGTHLNRQEGAAEGGAKRYGKYGVGLPKASISQCALFTAWSWTEGSSKQASKNGINTEDDNWVSHGAQVGESVKDGAPQKWIEAASLTKASSGTLVLWEHLDGLTWRRARWGENSGLIPNLEFNIGRTYRYLIGGEKASLVIRVIVLSDTFQVIEQLDIKPNDPLYITKGCDVPLQLLGDGTSWPTDDPLFDNITGKDSTMEVAVPTEKGVRNVLVQWKRSVARKNTFAKLDNRPAGSLPHGKHAGSNVGLSLLREWREVDMSLALSNPSEPRERWFGVEFNFPQELDGVLGMTNNKQSYTRLEQVLKAGARDYKLEDESTAQCLARIEKEDPKLAVCLKIAWKIDEVWKQTKSEHLNTRELTVIKTKSETTEEPTPPTPEQKAEEVATTVDTADNPPKQLTKNERDEKKKQVVQDLLKSNVPQQEAEDIAERLIEKGFTYAIVKLSNLGLPFFNVHAVVDAKIIQLNMDHPVFPYLLDTIEKKATTDPQELKKCLDNAHTAMYLMLEAWAKLESDVRGKDPKEYKMYQKIRSDWGVTLSDFIEGLNENSDK